jgi:4'-phosphopantetheinyl transferase
MLEVVVAPLELETRPPEHVLPEDERRRAAAFAFDRDRRRFIAARARLRQLLGERLGAAPASVELVYRANGKPELAPGHWRDLRFNVAHSGELAVYAFADGAEVGIDVEALREFEDADAIAARVFSPGEHQAYRAFGFFYCWTRKEAYLKALGLGLGEDLRALDTSRLPRGWRVESFAPVPGFVAALAVRERGAAA